MGSIDTVKHASKHPVVRSAVLLVLTVAIIVAILSVVFLSRSTPDLSVNDAFKQYKTDYVMLRLQPSDYGDKCTNSKPNVKLVSTMLASDLLKMRFYKKDKDYEVASSNDRINALKCDYYVIFNKHFVDEASSGTSSKLVYLPIIRVEATSPLAVKKANDKLVSLRKSDLSLVRELYEFGG